VVSRLPDQSDRRPVPAILEPMPLASWLFVRGSESIWIERPHGRMMVVAGPGPRRDEQEFADEDALQAYQVALATRLTDAGWFLWAFDRDRRQMPDRRSASRTTKDRRRRGTDVA
jgi:hypothetical protein